MSDWNLGMKLNSQIADVPLNHLIWLNDYKTYGENSYVYRNEDVWNEICSTKIAWDDSTFANLAEPDMFTDHIKDVSGYLLYYIGVETSNYSGNFLKLLKDDSFVLHLLKHANGIEKSTKMFEKIYEHSDLKQSYLSNFSSLELHEITQTRNGYNPVVWGGGTGTYEVLNDHCLVFASLVNGMINDSVLGWSHDSVSSPMYTGTLSSNTYNVYNVNSYKFGSVSFYDVDLTGVS